MFTVVCNPGNAREITKYNLQIYVKYFKLSAMVRKCLPVPYKSVLYYIAIKNFVCYNAAYGTW